MQTSLRLRPLPILRGSPRLRPRPRCSGGSRLYSTGPPPPSSKPGGRGWGSKVKTIAGALGLSTVAATLGAIYPPPPLTILFPRAAPGPPADPESPSSLEYSASLEEQLQRLPFIEAHRKAHPSRSPGANGGGEGKGTGAGAEGGKGEGGEGEGEWYEVRPYTSYPEERRVNNLTAGALRGPGKLAVRPLIRVRKDEKESVAVVHLGRGLCGHDGIVHGGLLATLLDESLGRTAIMNLPEKVGVTATLTLNYRAPTMADQFVVIRTQLDEVKGRKAFVKGRIETLEGTVLVEAR
ncbi:hypothetical protein NMY22_g19342 [Coprinellus aureogranulatus]|nr:hypothetical protein NMY22_g19342 [Coprinellus aureogranulatus]